MNAQKVGQSADRRIRQQRLRPLDVAATVDAVSGHDLEADVDVGVGLADRMRRSHKQRPVLLDVGAGAPERLVVGLVPDLDGFDRPGREGGMRRPEGAAGVIALDNTAAAQRA